MDISKVLSLLNDKNIDKKEVFALVDAVKYMDLTDEATIKNLIKRASTLAKKEITPELEAKLVEKIKKEGIGPGIIDLL